MRDRAGHVRREPEAVAPDQHVSPEAADPLRRIHDLQERAGNAAVAAMLGVQPRLQVGAVHDPAEAEADRIASQVLRHLDAGGAAAAPAQPTAGVARQVRRKAGQADASTAAGHGRDGGEALPETAAAIDRARGGGSTMDATTLGRMESAFGTDLSGVRVHTDGQAAQLSRDLNAKAFTTGNDVFFGAGEYKPGTRGGDEILAHELTHTVQQTGGARRIHRWNLSTPDWGTTKEIKTLTSGQAVLFLEDRTKDKIVVKRDDENVGLMKLAADLQMGINGTPTVTQKGLAGNDRLALVNLLQSGDVLSQPSFANLGAQGHLKSENGVAPAPFPGQTPYEQGQSEMLWNFTRKGNLVAMGFAPGESAADLAKTDDSGGSRFRNLLLDAGYVFDLGLVTAVDFFMNNADRVLTGNLGNWFVDAKKANVLIDSVDKETGRTWKGGDIAFDTMQYLGPSKIASGESARECLRGLLNGMTDKGGDTGAFAWSKGPGPGGGTVGDFIVQHLTAGLLEGRKRLLKKYGKKTKDKKAMMAVAEMRSKEDQKKGQLGGDGYGDVLEERIQALKSQT
jgi:hypothetical protein